MKRERVMYRLISVEKLDCSAVLKADCNEGDQEKA